jgi:isoleucyl-tRNA synthetase
MMTDLKKLDFTQRPNLPELEEHVLDYWDEIHAFEKSVSERSSDKPYVFYDGPPFATGLPHYGHLLGSIMKDIVPRYWTMKGFRVERKWGWDCHGLPIENIVEKELDLKGGKKGIEDLGIDKFNAACRSAIFRFDKEWEKIIRRIGRWVDFKHSYKTMDTTFMESVWWAFKQLHEKNLVYEGRKVILYCPRCSTPLSNFEIAMDNSYKDVEDNSVTIKFKRKGTSNEYILAWTTTPWTLIGNVGLAVAPDQPYVKINIGTDFYYLAEARLSIIEEPYEVVETVSGLDMVGWEYEPLYDYLDIGNKKAHYVASGDFVSMDDGTGVVHTAAMYGEDDFQLALKLDLPLVDMLDDQGKFLSFVTPLAGMFFKKAETWVVEDLTSRGLLHKLERFVHSYPHCYRCDTPLYYTGIPAWFINIQRIKNELVANNEPINWVPSHLKHGRFGKGLATAPDWNISRSRYWGTPIPIWRSKDNPDLMRFIGSLEELKAWAVDPEQVKDLHDIHREYIDPIDVWVDDAKTVKGSRIPEVFDCWVESGSMPFASEHYPFENEETFVKRHPAQFISEYIAQTRAWFYTLHVMSVALFGKHTFENALTTGTIMATDGSKMSKSKRNFTDPMLLVDKYGVDALRLYFASSPVMKTAENVNFSEAQVDEIRKKVLVMMWNVVSFYKLYDDGKQDFSLPTHPEHVLDQWLLSKVTGLTQTVTQAMDNYDVVTASRSLMEFVTDFSTWWLRLSRDRLRDANANAQALQVFRATLLRWSLLIAPFAPFFAELVYQSIVHEGKESIHLELLPEISGEVVNHELEKHMDATQHIVSLLHSLRKESGIPARQPLGSWSLDRQFASIFIKNPQLAALVQAEANVKALLPLTQEYAAKPLVKKASDTARLGVVTAYLDLELSAELEAEGKARELMRKIMDARKKAQTAHDEFVVVELPDWPSQFEDDIKAKVLATKLEKGEVLRIIRG